jgi:hypothetical protein
MKNNLQYIYVYKFHIQIFYCKGTIRDKWFVAKTKFEWSKTFNFQKPFSFVVCEKYLIQTI